MGDRSAIADRDWRLHAITTLAAPFASPWTGKTYEAGTPVEVVGTLRFGEREFSTPVPDAVALYMATAIEESRHGRDLQVLLVRASEEGRGSPGASLNLKAVEREYFNGLQHLISLVISSYSAIEAFANLTIPEGYVYRRTRAGGRCTEEYDRTQIEKYIPLFEKLDAVLPAITGASSPKGSQIWERFVRLQRLRDRLIHLKPSDWRENRPEARGDTIWSDLLAPEVLTLYEAAVGVVLHFTPGEKPRWLEELPRPL